MAKYIFIAMMLLANIIFAQDIPFQRNIDMQNNDIKNVDQINGVDAAKLKDSTGIDSMIKEVVNFDFAYMGTNPSAMGFTNTLRYQLEINTNTTIQIYNTENKSTVVSWYLIYTGQPTITILPPAGYTLKWGFNTPYTGPSTANVMDKIIIETFDSNGDLTLDTIIAYPAVLDIQ